MKTPSRFAARLGPPENGFLRVELSADTGSSGFFTSYTPNDPIRELVEALIGVSHETEASVTFNEEPARHVMTFRPVSGGMVILTITYHSRSSDPDRRTVEREETVFTTELPRDDLLRTFWRALRTLMGSVTPEVYRLNFRRPFPEDQMLRLSARLPGLLTSDSRDSRPGGNW